MKEINYLQKPSVPHTDGSNLVYDYIFEILWQYSTGCPIVDTIYLKIGNTPKCFKFLIRTTEWAFIGEPVEYLLSVTWTVVVSKSFCENGEPCDGNAWPAADKQKNFWGTAF